jgi:hypothetical protein
MACTIAHPVENANPRQQRILKSLPPITFVDDATFESQQGKKFGPLQRRDRSLTSIMPNNSLTLEYVLLMLQPLERKG